MASEPERSSEVGKRMSRATTPVMVMGKVGLLSAGCHAAVHDHARPDGGASLVRGEVGGHRGDLLRGYEPAVGLAGLHSLARLFGVVVAGGDAGDPGCVHRARGDAVDPHALSYVVYGRRPRERENAALRGRVGCPVVQAHQSGDGGHVDDGTASGVPHRRYGVLHPEERPFEAHIEHHVPVLFRCLRRGRGDAYAGVVHHDVVAAPLFDDALYEGLHLVLFGDVGLLDERVAFEFRGGFFCALLVHVGDHDPRAFFGHTQGYCTADPRARAGDDGALALQASHMLSPRDIPFPPSPLPVILAARIIAPWQGPRKRARGPEGRSATLKITDVRTAVIEANYDWTYTRIYTDEGITGIGESFLAPGLTTIIRDLKPLLVGEDPRNVDKLWSKLRWAASGAGSMGGIVHNAISGIEAALWDLVGKHYGAPIHALLGGKYRDRVRVYADCHAGEALESLDSVMLARTPKWMGQEVAVSGSSEANHPAHGRAYGEAEADEVFTPEMYAKKAREVVEQMGFSALKFDLDVPNPYSLDTHSGTLTNAEVKFMVSLVGAA